jgi:N utilization substance protein B
VARRKSRVIAFQALYSWDVGELDMHTLLDFSWLDASQKEKMGEEGLTFSRLLISGTIQNIEAIDEMIKKHLDKWDFNRLNKVDLAILRISTYPLLFQKEIHPSIIIDEAIDISKEFAADDSYKFINAVLDNIRKAVV